MWVFVHLWTQKHYLIILYTRDKHANAVRKTIFTQLNLSQMSIFISASANPGGRVQMLAATSQSDRSWETVRKFNGNIQNIFLPKGRKVFRGWPIEDNFMTVQMSTVVETIGEGGYE